MSRPSVSGAATVQLIVNPRPGRRARRRIAALRRAFETQGARVLVTPSASAPLAIDPRADHLCVVGGDGTLRHVVDALHRSGRTLPMSAYPLGTVNLLARERGYPRSPRAFALRVLGPGPRIQHHTALVVGVPMLTCASVGPDSRAVAMLSPMLKRRIGRAAYLVAFCGLLLRWPRAGLTVSWEGGRLACEAVYVAKGRFFAGPWMLAPDARADEPLLRVVALRDGSRLGFARFAWTLFRRRPVEAIDGATGFSCTALTIDGAGPVQVDGDIEACLPVRIALRAGTTEFS